MQLHGAKPLSLLLLLLCWTFLWEHLMHSATITWCTASHVQTYVDIGNRYLVKVSMLPAHDSS